MADAAQLQIHQLFELSRRSLTCTVRCVSGLIRVGASMRLLLGAVDRPLAESLTVSSIRLAGNQPIDFIDTGRTALVTVTGLIDDAAVRAAVAGTAPDELFVLRFRLVEISTT
jgi:hypothetical protein